jgi:hypothetical protein
MFVSPKDWPCRRLRFLTIPAVGLYLFVFVQMMAAAPPNEACDPPQSLQREIASKYPGAKLVSLSDLGDDDRGFFQKDHGDSCPGLVKVDFYGDGNPTLALVLITKDGAEDNTRLIVAHQVGQTWKMKLLDTGGASVPVVWSQGPDEYRDVYGEKTIRATRPVIVFCKYEAWAIVYAWTGKQVTKVWIMD